MIWNRIPILATLFPSSARREAAQAARRWRKAVAGDPALQSDLIRIGGLLTMQPVQFQDGFPEPLPIDPQRLAYEAGRRDLAIQLLALAGLTTFEMNSIMKENDDE